MTTIRGELRVPQRAVLVETVRVTIAHSLDAKKVAADYPASAHPYLYKLAPDTKLVRAHLDEAQLERYLTPSAPRIGLA